MAIGQGGYTGDLDEIAAALEGQSDEGKFLENYLRTPATFDAEKTKAQWDVIKQNAKDAGMSVLDWLGETAFKGSQNPTGLGQEILGAVTYPFRKTAEVSFDYVNPWSRKDDQGKPTGYMHSEQMPDWLSFINENQRLREELAKNPVIAAAPALLGGFTYPINEWAEGRDVTKGALTGGILSLLGPQAGLLSRFAGQGIRKAAPKLTDETVDLTRRKLNQALLVAGGLGATGAGVTKAVLSKSGQVVKGATLGASTVARSMANDGLVGLQALFKAADDMISGGGRYRPQAGGATIVNTVGDHSREMIHSIGDVTTTRSALIPTKMSLGGLDRAYLTFFGKFNRALKELDEGDTFVHQGRLGSNIDPKTNLPIMPETLPPSLNEPLKLTTYKLFKSEWDELAKAREAFERKWDLPTKGPKNYLNDYKPGPKFADDPIALRQFRDELNLITHNRQMAVQMQQWLDTLEIGMRHIEHLEITDPAKLRRVLQKVIADTRPGTGGGSGTNATATREMAEDILEALK